MLEISKKEAKQNFEKYSLQVDNAITVDEDDYNLILDCQHIYYLKKELYISSDININFNEYDITNMETVLVNIVLYKESTFSSISKIMDAIYNSVHEDANVILCTTPTKEDSKNCIKLNIYLGFD